MMNNFEERLASVRQGIMKRAAAMKEKAKKQGFEFKPFSRKQKQVLTWWCPSSPVKDKDGIIADGAIRSGRHCACHCPTCCGQWKASTNRISVWLERQSDHSEETYCFG